MVKPEDQLGILLYRYANYDICKTVALHGDCIVTTRIRIFFKNEDFFLRFQKKMAFTRTVFESYLPDLTKQKVTS